MRFMLWAVFVIVVMFGAAVSYADEIRLKNGDRITGQIKQMEKGALTIDTSYAGIITIDWNEVITFRTTAPIRLVLANGTSTLATANPTDTGSIELSMSGVEVPWTVALYQIDRINPPPEGPPVKLSGQVNLGVNITDGNTETESLFLDGAVVARTEKNRFTLGAEYHREKDDGTETADNSAGHIKYDHFFSDKWYGFAAAAVLKDDFKDLNLRTDMALGAGYQFWESERRNLSFELGLGYVNEDFISAPDENYAAGRWSVDFDHLLWKTSAQFFHRHVGLFGFEDIEDLIIRSRTGFRIPIYNNFNSTAQVKWDWDNSPPQGQKNSDTTYLFTLGYEF